MGAYNEELVKAGVMLAGDGLHPSSKGARVRFDASASAPSSTARSPRPRSSSPATGSSRSRPRRRRVEWARRAPVPTAVELEIRQVFEAEDFGEAFTPELQEKENDCAMRHAQREADRPYRRGRRRHDRTACDRRRLAHRVGPADRRAALRVVPATSGSPRNWRRTRWSPRSSSGRGTGCPDKPGAWLMATAKHRGDRHASAGAARCERKHGELGRELESGRGPGASLDPRRWTRWSRTTCCGWSSSPATRCCPARRGWR